MLMFRALASQETECVYLQIKMKCLIQLNG